MPREHARIRGHIKLPARRRRAERSGPLAEERPCQKSKIEVQEGLGQPYAKLAMRGETMRVRHVLIESATRKVAVAGCKREQPAACAKSPELSEMGRSWSLERRERRGTGCGGERFFTPYDSHKTRRAYEGSHSSSVND